MNANVTIFVHGRTGHLEKKQGITIGFGSVHGRTGHLENREED